MMQGLTGNTDVVSVALLVQAGAVIFWGGKIQQMLKDHERRIGKMESREEKRVDHLEERE
jgi:hypothetical protein